MYSISSSVVLSIAGYETIAYHTTLGALLVVHLHQGLDRDVLKTLTSNICVK